MVVRLSEIDVGLRMEVALEYVRECGLTGEPARRIALAAAAPAHDPVLRVAERKWRLVQNGKRPAGNTPVFG